MFSKVLVANRGEIACRVIRTLKTLGVKSVAIYSDADRTAPHVLQADEAVWVGPSAAAKSYLNVDAIVRAAKDTRSEAVHPGYGFLSENAGFAETLEAEGVRFIGPTPTQIRQFGLKHEARAIASRLGVPLLPGTMLLGSLQEAQAEAERIGLPLMLKSTAGGGGIGMQLCRSADQLATLFESVRSLATKNFADGGLFLERFVERARHIEVQIFGNGRGDVIALGERDCSAQRRNQKVLEEAPAPNLTDEVRRALHESAIALGKSVRYRSAGTVEFVYDEDRKEFYFLEVNTRLQVEHGVTELVFGVDLVEWMVKLAAGDEPSMSPRQAQGHAIEARVYAEDAARGYQPCAGMLTEVSFPKHLRVDGWIEAGCEVSGFYDPMLAKVLAFGATRSDALTSLHEGLRDTKLAGIETNLEYLRELTNHEVVRDGRITTAFLAQFAFKSATIEVLEPGTMTTIQDYPGRLGYWDVGIPPSGPMDDFHFRLANRIVGNQLGAAALEITMTGPTLRFATDTVIGLAGARLPATLDGAPFEYFEPIAVRAGQTLKIGGPPETGCRTYLAIQHGFDVPEYLGSKSTFTLGGFGGHGGRALRKGDILHLATEGSIEGNATAIHARYLPPLQNTWELGVIYGPHGAPDFFTEDDIETLFRTLWIVHYNSARTGVRLIGPKPQWARPDGGEAGLHPSNLHDNAYAVGTIDFTGDMPILLGPDGPSLGGFVCPATIVAAERWKLGQLKPGDTVHFVPISFQQAERLELQQNERIANLNAPGNIELETIATKSAILDSLAATETRPLVTYRPCGDEYLLVEYGPMVLDLTLRFRVHQLMERLAVEPHPAIVDLTPGIRSLQIHFDSRKLRLAALLTLLERIESEIPAVDQIEVPTRIVHLPLSWDDPATRLAIEKYMQGVRNDAPWTPSNLEFIRRINGLSSIDDVKRIVFDASYLVLGLGDVYLGAPVATPVDPRHRLVTTKYNPARTWTPENAVGIGGAYLCIYGMEGPGGYQFVGRTLQVYNRFKQTREFAPDKPWLLRFFDQIRFYPVDAQELLEMRDAFPHGKVELKITEERFSLREYQQTISREAESISSFKAAQQAAFDDERRQWVAQLESGDPAANTPMGALQPAVRDHRTIVVESHVHGSVWKVLVALGDPVEPGQTLLLVESMKMEIAVASTVAGTVTEILASEGREVAPGQALVVVIPINAGDPR